MVACPDESRKFLISQPLPVRLEVKETPCRSRTELKENSAVRDTSSTI